MRGFCELVGFVQSADQVPSKSNLLNICWTVSACADDTKKKSNQADPNVRKMAMDIGFLSTTVPRSRISTEPSGCQLNATTAYPFFRSVGRVHQGRPPLRARWSGEYSIAEVFPFYWTATRCGRG